MRYRELAEIGLGNRTVAFLTYLHEQGEWCYVHDVLKACGWEEKAVYYKMVERHPDLFKQRDGEPVPSATRPYVRQVKLSAKGARLAKKLVELFD